MGGVKVAGVLRDHRQIGNVAVWRSLGRRALLASHVFVDVRDNPAFEDRYPDGYGEDIFE
jgi:hypothetical protein